MFVEQKLDMILEKIEELSKRIDRMEIKGVMNVTDIAKYTGVSRNALYSSKRYLLPYYGEKPEGAKLEWTKAEVFRWLDRDIEVLKANMPKTKLQEY